MSGQHLEPLGVRLEDSQPPPDAGGVENLSKPIRCTVYLLPTAIFVVLCGVVGLFWRLAVRDQVRDLDTRLVEVHSHLSSQIRQSIENRVRPLERLARQRMEGDLDTPEKFSNAARLQEAKKSDFLAIWLVTDPDKEAKESARMYELAVKKGGESSHGVMVELPKASEVLLGVPVIQESHQTEVLGVVVGRLQLQPLFEHVVDKLFRDRFRVVVQGSQGQMLFQSGEATPPAAEFDDSFTVLGVQWRMLLWPNAAYVDSSISQSPRLILWGGLACSLLMSLWVGVWMMIRHRRIREAWTHLEALERLAELSVAINSKIGSGPEVLNRLAHAACDLMGMSSAVVGILDDARQRLNIVATVGVKAMGLGEYSLDASPGVRHCLHTGKIVIVEDSQKVGGLVNVEEMNRVGVRLAMELPLRIESRAIGVLLVGNVEPGRVDAARLHLARLLANQAAVILANHRLYEQMDQAITVQRRDADARAVLLRELNHRVKNNLAGIVGLLSAGQPQMSADARQWLGRVIERIGNMARTHELLSGGMQSIALHDLVEQVLPSLALVKPPGVRIMAEMGGVDVLLGTERAVGLAMVLHELCYNAIVHGSGEDGCITIRARAGEGLRVVVEVMDDGGGGRKSGVEGESAQRGSGMGLTLVRGLVSRELQGEFSLCGRPAGGTVATVVFPLRDSEMDDVSI